MSKITPPNYTQIPNIFFDEIMATLNGGETKVMLAIMRKTFGWQKKKDKISYSQIQEMTGLARQSISDAFKGLLEKDLIECHVNKQSHSYSVKLFDQSINQTSPESRPDAVQKVDRLNAKPVQKLDTQKKESKETNKENSSAAQCVLKYYLEKHKKEHNDVPVDTIGKCVTIIKSRLETCTVDDIIGSIDFNWTNEFVVKNGHAIGSILAANLISVFKANRPAVPKEPVFLELPPEYLENYWEGEKDARN